jgi:hypothetical protein
MSERLFLGAEQQWIETQSNFIADVERVMSLCSRDWIKLT